MVFPSRLWEVIALNQALEQDPQDDKAKYYLGNFLYAHQRFAEAIQLWEQALAGLACLRCHPPQSGLSLLAATG